MLGDLRFWYSTDESLHQITSAACVDVGNFSAIAFGDTTAPIANGTSCRAFPGTPDWPIDEEWNHLNSTLGGALLKPTPLGAVCYNGTLLDPARCRYLLFNGSRDRVFLNDPLNVFTQWPEGETCPVAFNPQGNCTQGGFPTYVVNVTTVKQIQIAVNFARNKNLRLVIKNTGHDFSGRSTGAGSLSIWTHYLKSFDFLTEYDQGPYHAAAARVGAGLEAWELYAYMDQYNITIIVPGGSTVGAYGGWFLGGGHSVLASTYGLGSDQALSLQVVTADGRFVTADPSTNQDLFYALLGGGPGTFGVVTSAIVKAFPPLNISESFVTFTGGNISAPTLVSNHSSVAIWGNFTAPVAANIQDLDTFWYGVSMVYAFSKDIVDGGGTAYSYIAPRRNNTFSFTTTLDMPQFSMPKIFGFVQPLIDSLNALGIAVNNTPPTSSTSWGSSRHGEGDSPGDARFASRFFPYSNWDNGTLFNNTMHSIRQVVEAGSVFHGISMKPWVQVAGYPGNNAVNPAFRKTIMHADVFDFATPSFRGPTQAVIDKYAVFNVSMNKIRAATPGSGSYINEGDVQEPDWQQSFFGDNYQKLLAIKKQRDPWGLFWAPSTVGSEAWEVVGTNGLPTQNGQLCRTNSS
ncbi:FAD binding domain-containing protein [Hyaloscypha variabilis F]|uniref:FAD binding domain-containing protein n=1 Tax=Hyaloscypha variabilis (strain UAMH 11265 / GT02V1 / F) TaxID=1149755 RepID=A0A2J6RL51_HYAVF|nr:FAD binding domain-containing protein [Hyaloscypha variabilis F]